MEVIECIELTKRYRGKTVVDRLSLSIHESEVFGLLGRNGAGKTTTLRMLLGLIRPSAGEAIVMGHKMPYPGVLPQIGSMIEEPAFYPWMSGRRNLQVFVDTGAPVTKDSIEKALEHVGLDSDANRKVKTYSQGMRQRLGLALAIVRIPKILILDEPTNGLDPTGIKQFRDLVRELASGGTTILLSSHLLSEMEQICDRVGILDHGRLVSTESVRELSKSTGCIRVVVPISKQADAQEALAIYTIANEAPGVLTVVGASGDEVNELLASRGIFAQSIESEKTSLESLFFALSIEEDKKDNANAPT